MSGMAGGNERDTQTAALSHAEAFQSVWPQQQGLSLCERMARKGIAMVAQNGECPVHGGDGCLYNFVQVVGVRNALGEVDGRPW